MERKSSPRVNLIGKTFTYLTPQYYIKGGKWHCRCKCGNELDVDTRNLNSQHTKSCGCLQKEKASQSNTLDMSSYEDDYIKVLSRAGSDDKGSAMWECLCKTCSKNFTTRGRNIREDNIKSCGCVHSLNERLIAQILSDNNIEFATQYTFPDLFGINGGKLRFDFAVFKDKQLSHLIEYNGSQHYNKPHGSWESSFTQIQEHDKIKQEYCKTNNLRLVIVNYTQTYSLKDLL